MNGMMNLLQNSAGRGILMSGQAGEVEAMQSVNQDTPRERGRPARTIDWHSLALSATWIKQQRCRGTGSNSWSGG